MIASGPHEFVIGNNRITLMFGNQNLINNQNINHKEVGTYLQNFFSEILVQRNNNLMFSSEKYFLIRGVCLN